MKKNYSTPAVHITLFASENLITASGVEAATDKARSSFGSGVSASNIYEAEEYNVGI